MFASLVAKILAFLADKGLTVGGAVAPYALMLAPAAAMILSGVALYFFNRASGTNLIFMGIESVSEAVVCAQIARAAAAKS